MAGDSKIEILLQLQGARKFQKDAEVSGKAVSGVGRSGVAAGRGLDTATKKAGLARRGFGALAGAAKVGAFALGGLLVVEAKRSIEAFDESRRVTAATAQVIKTTGGAAGVTAKEVAGMATAMSLKTGIDDEVIQKGQNMLLTFKNVRNEAGKGGDIFRQTSMAAVDMAAGFAAAGKEMSTTDATLQLGKALNSPAEGLTRLTRVGVTFTKQQEKQVKSMVKAGNTAGAQRVMLKELQSQFGGQAAAGASASDKFKVALGNLEEQIGEKLWPVMEKGAEAGAKFVTQLTSGHGGGGEFAETVTNIWEAVKPVAKWFGIAAKDVAVFAAEHPKVAKLAVAIGGAGVAINAIRTSRAVSGISTLLGSLRKLAATKAGTTAAENIAGSTGLGGLRGRLTKPLTAARGLMNRMLGRAGTTAGTTAATTTASSLSTGIGPQMGKRKTTLSRVGTSTGGIVGRAAGTTAATTAAAGMVGGGAAGGGGAAAAGGLGGKLAKQGGKFKSMGSTVGKKLGGGIVLGLVLMGPEIVKSVRDALGITPGEGKFGQYSGGAGYGELGKDLVDSPRELLNGITGLGIGNATGGLITRSRHPSLAGVAPRGDDTVTGAQYGEFMMSKKAVRQFGVHNLEAINAGRAPRVAPPPARQTARVAPLPGGGVIEVHVHHKTELDSKVLAEGVSKHRHVLARAVSRHGADQRARRES